MPGEEAFFEYHCEESPESSDSVLWYHSHQKVKILREEPSDAPPEMPLEERQECGAPKVYKIEFSDGLTHIALEDELMTNPAGYFRPDPPKFP